MRAVNEPWDQTKPAPRLYVGALLDGAVRWLFGRGIPPGALPALESILRALADDAPGPVGVSALRDALAGLLPVLGGERRDTELCYRVPHLPTPAVDCALITEANIGQFALGPFGWLRDEITSAQPCAALVDKGRAVSICRSVRISPAAHEAGIETLPECRGQGLAGRALALWARAVRAVGAIPLYSTAWDNAASRRVAQKAGLALYASGFSIW